MVDKTSAAAAGYMSPTQKSLDGEFDHVLKSEEGSGGSEMKRIRVMKTSPQPHRGEWEL